MALSKLIAKVAYQAANAYRKVIGEMTKVEWDDVEDAVKTKLINAVKSAMENPKTPEQQHNAWLEQMIIDGWKYGETLDEEKKEHPEMLPYQGLPIHQQVKDSLFLSVVDSLKDLVLDPAAPAVTQQISDSEKVGVKYVGKRDKYTDGMYGSMITWKKDEVIMVPMELAVKLFQHPTVYQPAIEVVDKVAEPVKEAKNDEAEEEKLQSAKDAVNAMRRKDSVINFAEVTFSGVKLSNEESLSALKQKVIGFIDQYGIS